MPLYEHVSIHVMMTDNDIIYVFFLMPRIFWQNGRAEWSSIESCHFGHAHCSCQLHVTSVYTKVFDDATREKVDWTFTGSREIEHCVQENNLFDNRQNGCIVKQLSTYRSCHVFFL